MSVIGPRPQLVRDNDNISSICKLMLIVTLVMMLAESPGLDSLLIIVTLVSVFVKKMKIEG